MLSDRRQQILRALIEEYVANAMPVGSRTLNERYKLGVSSATIRNELSALEEDGYISQPHTSAGRIPTDYGYRTFVDSLFSSGLASSEEKYQKIADELRESATELDALMEHTSAALARLTHCLSIVMAPTVHDLSIMQITLVAMDMYHVLLVLVTEDGQVLNHRVAFPDAINTEELATTQRFLNEMLVGKSFVELQSGLAKSITEAWGNPYVRLAISGIIECMQEACQDTGTSRAHRLGLSALMSQPEFAHSSDLVPIMQILEDNTVLWQLFESHCECDSEEPSVTIGTENAEVGLPGVSVVASKYGRGDSAGVVAVIGPTRMDYSNVIKAVRAASSALHED